MLLAFPPTLMSPLDVVKFPELPVTLMEPELVLADPTVPSMEMLMTLSLMTSSLSPMIILSPSIVMFEPGGAFIVLPFTWMLLPFTLLQTIVAMSIPLSAFQPACVR